MAQQRGESRRALPPLPPGLRRAVEAAGVHSLPKRAHPGLMFERYPRLWPASHTDLPLGGPGNRAFLLEMVEGFRAQGVTRSAELQAAIARHQRLAGEGRAYATSWRLVTGVGAAHPLENGFTFHPTLGVPFLAGSAVKGLVRRVAELMEPDVTDRVQRLFGPAEVREQGDGRAGQLIFLDALPDSWPTLAADVMNPHHAEWHAMAEEVEGANLQDLSREKQRDVLKSAGGLRDPIPIYMLTVEAGSRFRFFITSRRKDVEAEDMEQVWEWLTLGLTHLGIGAKTAAGYGHFQAEAMDTGGGEIEGDAPLPPDEVWVRLVRMKGQSWMAEVEGAPGRELRMPILAPSGVRLNERYRARVTEGTRDNPGRLEWKNS